MLTEEEFSRYQRILSVRRNSNKVFERWQYLPWHVTVILTSFSFAFTVYMVSMHPTHLDNLCNICFQRCKSFLPVVFSLACCGRHWNFYSLMKFNVFFLLFLCSNGKSCDDEMGHAEVRTRSLRHRHSLYWWMLWFWAISHPGACRRGTIRCYVMYHVEFVLDMQNSLQDSVAILVLQHNMTYKITG